MARRTALRIGIVDLDTSHPAAFVPLIRTFGHDVVAVHDGGTVFDPGYAATFADEHGISHAYATVEEMVDRVDAAFVQGTNWDTHLGRARPFADAGIPIFIDKPFAGSAADLRELVNWEARGLRVAGGSALRWCTEAETWRAKHGADGATFGWAHTTGHPLDYGVHAHSLLHGLMGPGIASVRHLDDRRHQRVELRWRDGRAGLVTVAPPGQGYGFFATVLTTTGVEHIDVGLEDIYRPLLRHGLAYLAGDEPAPLPMAELIEPELAVLAASASAEDGGRWMALDDPAVDEVRFDGAAFAAEYRDRRRAALGR